LQLFSFFEEVCSEVLFLSCYICYIKA
jgi:hypothetical protein